MTPTGNLLLFIKPSLIFLTTFRSKNFEFRPVCGIQFNRIECLIWRDDEHCILHYKILWWDHLFLLLNFSTLRWVVIKLYVDNHNKPANELICDFILRYNCFWSHEVRAWWYGDNGSGKIKCLVNLFVFQKKKKYWRT